MVNPKSMLFQLDIVSTLKYGYLFNVILNILIFKALWYKNKIVLESTQNQRFLIVKFRRWFNVDKLTLFRIWNTCTFSTLM